MTKKASTLKGFDNIFSTRLRKLMERDENNKITQQTLADKTGCSRQAISQYMDGSSTPNVDKLISIAKFFGVSTDYLLGLAQEPTTDMELNAICEYTGLDEKSVKQLVHFKNNNSHLLDFENYLISNEILGLVSALLGDYIFSRNGGKIDGGEIDNRILERHNGLGLRTTLALFETQEIVRDAFEYYYENNGFDSDEFIEKYNFSDGIIEE